MIKIKDIVHTLEDVANRYGLKIYIFDRGFERQKTSGGFNRYSNYGKQGKRQEHII